MATQYSYGPYNTTNATIGQPFYDNFNTTQPYIAPVELIGLSNFSNLTSTEAFPQ